MSRMSPGGQHGPAILDEAGCWHGRDPINPAYCLPCLHALFDPVAQSLADSALALDDVGSGPVPERLARLRERFAKEAAHINRVVTEARREVDQARQQMLTHRATIDETNRTVADIRAHLDTIKAVLVPIRALHAAATPGPYVVGWHHRDMPAIVTSVPPYTTHVAIGSPPLTHEETQCLIGSACSACIAQADRNARYLAATWQVLNTLCRLIPPAP